MSLGFAIRKQKYENNHLKKQVEEQKKAAQLQQDDNKYIYYYNMYITKGEYNIPKNDEEYNEIHNVLIFLLNYAKTKQKKEIEIKNIEETKENIYIEFKLKNIANKIQKNPLNIQKLHNKYLKYKTKYLQLKKNII